MSERVRELLDYNPVTGEFTWRVARGGSARVGAAAGTINHHGYRCIWVDGSPHQAAQLAVLYMTGRFPAFQVDHINGVRHDDRWENLREVSQSQQMQNRGKFRTNKSGFKGVFWCNQKRRWVAAISVGGKRTYLGSFSCPKAAGLAYSEASTRLHGEYARASQRG